ncbi:hypothetical protein PVR90_001044, partial [Escherichia coli]|nr:hypothetical protein [Escherichia coli]
MGITSAGMQSRDA